MIERSGDKKIKTLFAFLLLGVALAFDSSTGHLTRRLEATSTCAKKKKKNGAHEHRQDA